MPRHSNAQASLKTSGPAARSRCIGVARERARVLAKLRCWRERIPLGIDYSHGISEGYSEKSENAGVSKKIGFTSWLRVVFDCLDFVFCNV